MAVIVAAMFTECSPWAQHGTGRLHITEFPLPLGDTQEESVLLHDSPRGSVCLPHCMGEKEEALRRKGTCHTSSLILFLVP